jgi:hypothetical protein
MSAATQCRISRLLVVQGSETAWWPFAEVSWFASSACTSGSWRQRNLQRGSWKWMRETQFCISNCIGTCSGSILSRLSCVYCHLMCICYTMCLCICYTCCCTLDARLLARSQYPEGPATGHLDTGFSWFPCVYKRMLRWFPKFQVATTCFSCSPPQLNFLVTYILRVK